VKGGANEETCAHHRRDWNRGRRGGGDTCGAATTGSVDFVTGPATPPAGTGSVKLTVGSNGDSYPTVRYSGANGVALSAITALTYSTYISQPAVGSQAPYLDVYVDWNNDNTRDDIITFEPVYQTGQPVVTNTWQTWNALTGEWWSDFHGGPPPLYTLAQYIALHPNATILNVGASVILAAGCGAAAWPNFVGSADALTINTTTFDFEPAAPVGPAPTSKAQCKKGGWKNFTNPSFKNQGQCVAYVNHHDGKGQDDKHAGKKK
jgi:hypothetical protein